MGKRPQYRAVVKVGEKQWREVGAAWSRKEGKLSLQLSTMPIPEKGKASVLLVPNDIEKRAE